MSLLIILLAWRLVIESFVDIFGVSSLCMQIIRKCKSIGLSRKAWRACESVIPESFSCWLYITIVTTILFYLTCDPSIPVQRTYKCVTFNLLKVQSLELGVGWHEGILCFWYYNCYFPILTSAWDKIIAVTHLAHSPDDASKKHQQQLLWHWH